VLSATGIIINPLNYCISKKDISIGNFYWVAAKHGSIKFFVPDKQRNAFNTVRKFIALCYSVIKNTRNSNTYPKDLYLNLTLIFTLLF